MKTSDIERALNQAVKKHLASLTFPPFPESGSCGECDGSDWLIVEPGYWRNTSAETVFVDDDPTEAVESVHATTDGWDDMSENGLGLWLTCANCFEAYAAPTSDIEWD